MKISHARKYYHCNMEKSSMSFALVISQIKINTNSYYQISYLLFSYIYCKYIVSYRNWKFIVHSNN